MERGGDGDAMRRLSMIAYCAWCFLLSSFYGLRQKSFSVSSIRTRKLLASMHGGKGWRMAREGNHNLSKEIDEGDARSRS